MTAVEWLLDRIEDVDLNPDFWEQIKFKANEMEKKQIIEAYNDGQAIPPFDYAEKYYDRNYKPST